jgi:hypothetical protein
MNRADPNSSYAILERAVASPLDHAVDDAIARENEAFMHTPAFKEMQERQADLYREWQARVAAEAVEHG